MERIEQDPVFPLSDGDALIVVPPFFDVAKPSLAAHVLQACAREAGFRVSVLYANILLAAALGLEVYTEIGFPPVYPPQTMAGERLFARAAYGLPALGSWSDRMFDLSMAFGPSWARWMEITRLGRTESLSLSSSELRQVEERAAAWVEELAGAIVQRDFKIVGCSSSFAQTNASMALFKHIKRENPQVVTVLGGSNCEGDMALGIASLDPDGDRVDYIFSGESEAAFVKFLQGFFEGRLPAGRVIEGAPCEDLDALPTPDFAEYFEQLEYALPALAEESERVVIMYESSRGCWWGQKHQCTFCGVNGKRIGFREKSPERVMEDLALFAERYPAGQVYMADSIMTFQYFETLVPRLMEARLPLSIGYGQKANLDLAQVLALKEAGIDTIQPGIEALSSNLLKRMSKGVRAPQNIMLLRYGRAVGMRFIWAILWGIPGDEREDYEQTLALLPLLRHLPPPGLLHLSVDRFSPYFERPEEYGVQNVTPLGGYAAVFPPHADVEKLAYHFVADYECASHRYPELIEQVAWEIRAWQACWEPRASPVMLHVLPSGETRYVLMDTRGLPGTQKMQVLDHRQAMAALTARPYVETADGHAPDEIAWALEQKIGVVVDDWYVPLATAEPELLQACEEEARRRPRTQDRG